MKKSLFTFIFLGLIAAGFLSVQPVLAGDPGCQPGSVNNVQCNQCQRSEGSYDWVTNKTTFRCVTITPVTDDCRRRGYSRFAENRQRKQFAAAQTRSENNLTPHGGGLSSGGGFTGGGGGFTGGDSWARSGFSFSASIMVLLGGIWTLFVLLRARFVKPRSTGRRVGALTFVLKPSFALAGFGFLFAATIVGSIFVAPNKATAEKRDQRNKSQMTGAFNPSNKPVFKSAQVIGSDLMTQIGPPVFDAAGNRYVRGGFSGDLQIGATTLTASAGYDLFFAKYDADGNPLWARQAIGARREFAIEGATAMSVDSGGNVYIGGSFAKQATFQGGANPSITLADAGGSGVNYESFVVKYDADGNLLWAKGGASGSPQSQTNLDTGQNGISQIVFDASGNPYVAGFVAGNNFLGAATVVNGQTDILLAKLDKMTGAVTWRQVIGGTGDDNGLDLKTDGGDNLYLIGNYGSPQITFPNGTTFGNQDDPNDSLSSSTNTFIAKFDASGDNSWVQVIDNPSSVSASQIAISGAGEIYLTGYFFNSATFGDTTLTETEGGGEEDENGLGGYVAKMDANGDFIWTEGFGGSGKGLALDAAGRVYLIGAFFDGGTFGLDTPNEETLASFGGQDLFIARYDADGGFDWAKAIAGNGYSGTPVASLGNSENYYFPFGIAYNPARGTMFIAGDFRIAAALDCLTLTTAGEENIKSYLAELSADTETTSCRIWNGLDDLDNNFDSIDNWNGGVLPVAGDSVYVPYTGNNFDAPDYNPSTDIPLSNLTVTDDRILTLGRNLTVNGRLDLLGGFIDAESFPLLLGEAAQSLSTNDGLILGRVQKQFAAGNTGAFTFPVGTADSEGFAEYSPVTLSNIAGMGGFSVTANRGVYPNAATNLPANRAARWWNLTNGGLTKADLTFQYVEGDITAGDENSYRAFRIPTGGGTATPIGSSINTTTKTVTAPNVTGFSDWTLAQPMASTAATVSVSGTVTTGKRGVAGARVSFTDANGITRTARTNAFGYYRFSGVEIGQIYVFSISSKRYSFAPRVVTVTADLTDLNFTGQ